MPRATDLSSRLALVGLVRTGATASDIAQQLGLPLSTVRGLMRRARPADPEDIAAVVQTRYHACGPQALEDSPWLETTLELRRRHPRWGAGRIRVELRDRSPGRPLPSERTIQRWLRRHGLAPAPPGRPQATSWRRAEHPHQVWEVDAADQKRLATGEMISWLRVVDECSGAVLWSRVFPPRLFHPGAPRGRASRVAELLRRLGPTAVGARG